MHCTHSTNKINSLALPVALSCNLYVGFVEIIIVSYKIHCPANHLLRLILTHLMTFHTVYSKSVSVILCQEKNSHMINVLLVPVTAAYNSYQQLLR